MISETALISISSFYKGGGYFLAGDDVNLIAGISAEHPSGTSNIIQIDISMITSDQNFIVENENAQLTLNGNVNLNGLSLAFAGDGDLIMNGQIGGSGDVFIQAGAVIFNNDNSYDGGTVINGGSLVVNSATSGTGPEPVVVNDGASLLGEGVILGAVVVNADGMVIPGDQGPGILEVGDADFNAGSILALEINGDTVNSEFAQLLVNDSVQLDNPRLQIALGFDPAIGTDFLILDNNGGAPIGGTFNNLPEGETFSLTGLDTIGFSITYQGGDGNDVVLTAIPTLSINDVTVTEGDGSTVNAVFTVTLSEASSQTVTVLFDTEDGSAVAGTDYQATQGTLTFNPGDTTETISVPVFADSADEGNETFLVNLFSPSNATIVVSPGEGTIQDNGGGGGGGGCGLSPMGSVKGAGMGMMTAIGILAWTLWRKSSAKLQKD